MFLGRRKREKRVYQLLGSGIQNGHLIIAPTDREGKEARFNICLEIIGNTLSAQTDPVSFRFSVSGLLAGSRGTNHLSWR